MLFLAERQLQAVSDIKMWLEDVSKVILPQYRRQHFKQYSPSDVFIGYHDDAPASVCLRYFHEGDGFLVQAKRTFLQCATPDAVSRYVVYETYFTFENMNQYMLDVHCSSKLTNLNKLPNCNGVFHLF